MFNFFNKKKEVRLEKALEHCKVMVLKGLLDLELEEIKKWHEKTFPDATLAGQLAKLEEEINENLNADKESFLEEVADVLIVCAGLLRFDSKIGVATTNKYVEHANSDILAKIINAIQKKMEKNKKRKWKKTEDGRFHHEG